MDYEEKLARLGDEDFFSFFTKMHAEPRWVTSAGHKSIQLLGICHHGGSHSAVFDPTTMKVTCFSECGGGMLFHTWVKKVLDTENPQEAKDFIEDWCDDQHIDFENRLPKELGDFEYVERPFERKEDIPIVEGIKPIEREQLYRDDFTHGLDILSRLRWCTDEGIHADILQLFEVACIPQENCVILPHHNREGEIVGIYARSYRPLRRDIMKEFPEEGWDFYKKFPRAKYVPLVKEKKYLSGEEDEKTSWSFPNGRNLYGLHLTHPYIADSKTAIIFEGGKSVMLAWQWGIRNCVATHTFGTCENHLNMLLNEGATTIIFGFDKQYQSMAEDDKQWVQYEHRTYEMARRIKDYCDVYRLCDPVDGQLDYKDAPVDKGLEYFQWLLDHKQPLFVGGVDVYAERKEEEIRAELRKAGTTEKLTDEEILENDERLIATHLLI